MSRTDAAPSGTERPWGARLGGGVVLFLVAQVVSGVLYGGAAVENVAGFPLAYLRSVEGTESGTSLVFSPEALVVDGAVLIAVGAAWVAFWQWRWRPS